MNVVAATMAWYGFNFPEGNGLSRFLGCFLSFSISKTSFIRYILPDSKQNMKKADIIIIHKLIFNHIVYAHIFYAKILYIISNNITKFCDNNASRNFHYYAA